MTVTRKQVREGSPTKRAAILAAARDLFVRQGVDRVSMDAVAATAKVSKATVYEYFGDRQRLFQAILDAASESLDATARKVLAKHLADDAGIASVPALEQALTAAAVDLGTTLVGSAEYAAAFALVAQQRWQDPATGDDVATQAAEDLFAERLAHFAEQGLLETDDPRRAGAHFFALTMLLAYNEQPIPTCVDIERVRQTMVDGVRTFIRAYGVR